MTIFEPFERLRVHFLDLGGGVTSGPAATAIRVVWVDGRCDEEVLLLLACHVYVLLFEDEAGRALVLTQKWMMGCRCRRVCLVRHIVVDDCCRVGIGSRCGCIIILHRCSRNILAILIVAALLLLLFRVALALGLPHLGGARTWLRCRRGTLSLTWPTLPYHLLNFGSRRAATFLFGLLLGCCTSVECVVGARCALAWRDSSRLSFVGAVALDGGCVG